MPSALIQALRGRNPAAVRAALEANPEEAHHAAAAVKAAGMAFLPGLKLLHLYGADFNGIWRGYRPLHALIQEKPHEEQTGPTREQLTCFDWLLKHGADPEQPGAWPPARALVVAAFAGRPEYVERLRQRAPRLDAFTAAALGDRVTLARILREKPEFAGKRDTGGLTALQCAAGSRLSPRDVLECARLLIHEGAPVQSRTRSWSHEIDACYLAAAAGHKEMFALMLASGADPSEALTHALWHASEDLAEIAMAQGAVPNRATADGQPLLNNLIRWGRIRQALWLLHRGASPNIPDARGWTAVHQAASRGNQRMLRALAEAGGDHSRRDHAGRQPRDV
jgi:ankyrin repeat protein